MTTAMKPTRRTLVATAAGLAATAALGGRPVAARQAATPIVAPVMLDGAAIRVGGACAISGRYGTLGLYQWQGYELWARDVNARGGLLGKPVVLSLVDDSSDPVVAGNHYAGLLARNAADVLLPPYSSTVLAGVAPVVGRAGWPMVTAGGSLPAIVEQGGGRIHNIYVPEVAFLHAIVDQQVVAAGLDRVVVLGQESEFGDAARTGCVARLVAQGITPALDLAYSRDAATPGDFADIVAQLAAIQPDAILAATYLADGIALVQALRDAQIAPQTLALTIAPTSPGFVAALGAAAEGVLAPSFWEPGIATPGNAEFEAAYAAAWPGMAPEYHVATGYAIGQVMEAAIVAAGSVDPVAVAAALATIAVETVMPGEFRVGPQGGSDGAIALTIQIQDGAAVVVGPAEFAGDADVRPFAPWDAR